jgi:hypothetical protein
MKESQSKIFFQIRLVTVILLTCGSFGGFFYSRLISKTFGSGYETLPTPTPPAKKAKTDPKVSQMPSKYAHFQHNTHLNLKLVCDSCHQVPTANWDKVRSKDQAFPDVTDYPKHESCLKCHQQQFFSGKPPAICSNCHLNPSPNDSSRHPFANPREIFDLSPKGKISESAFEISFPHDKHIEIVSQNENDFKPNSGGGGVFFVKAGRRGKGEESCAVCHQTYHPQGKSDVEFITAPPKDLGDQFWLKKGTFKTAPTGHTTCFTCHSTDTGILPAPTDCATCHKLKEPPAISDFDPKMGEKIGITEKQMLLQWRKRDSSATFRHELEMHADLSCDTCHNVKTMLTNDAKTKKVAVLSCAPCHVTATTNDGGVLNAEIDSRKKDANFACVKCHLSFGKMPVPESHTKAIESLK